MLIASLAGVQEKTPEYLVAGGVVIAFTKKAKLF
jgi:hypothetical protein